MPVRRSLSLACAAAAFQAGGNDFLPKLGPQPLASWSEAFSKRLIGALPYDVIRVWAFVHANFCDPARDPALSGRYRCPVTGACLFRTACVVCRARVPTLP